MTEAARAALRVLFSSEHVVVVDKPAGIATEPDARGSECLRDQVAWWLAQRGTRARVPHAVSRLDTNVSGAVTFAVSDAGTKMAASAQARGELKRTYLAITKHSAIATGRWDLPVQGKAAATRFATIASAGGRVSLMKLQPETGRTHQLRIHAASAGAAILGDARYGGPTSIAGPTGLMIRVGRVLLHAVSVGLPRAFAPDSEAFVVAPIPADMIALWQALDGEPEAWNEAIGQRA